MGTSRRQADDLIQAGRVWINGAPATLGSRLQSSDTLAVDGKPLAKKSSFSYLLLHKPVGYVCSRRQQGSVPTIYSLLPKEYHALKPVGRLDADSSGLLLLSDDGDFAYRMTHPKFLKQKTYLVTLDKDLEPLHQQMISDFGIQLEDGPSQMTLERQEAESQKKWIVYMSEGRNRQIRRTFSSLGYTVTKLHRTHFGDYTLDELPRGQSTPIQIPA
jgi:23S rRNA pseudouridine2605 synthase